MDASSGGNHGGGRAIPFTKVNRCMAEGRKAFLERFVEIYRSAG
jgi:hypothetical protein